MLGALLISLLLFVLSIFFYACALTLFVRKTNRNRRRVRDYLDCQMLLSSRRQWQQPAKSPK
ncbi:uncharacterized protein LOC135431778 isoform X18 [Drosophila montana]|uniref:uncharacterized protein LOC135431778 isoform X18 n=1 Tax=Drosophila montana TaxID=40370 RepID=UPI00313B9031